jgi:hypothetical protein
MRSQLLAALGIVVGLATSGVHAQQQFRLFATMVDGTGGPAKTVKPEDVRVMENGVVAKVVKVEPIDWPVKIQLLVDNGIGLGGENIIHLRNGVKALLEGLPQGTEVTFVTTAPQPRFLVRATTDKQMLLAGIDRLAPDSGAGRFVDSLNEATARIEKDKTDYFPVIITAATTSGDNNILERDVQRIMTRLQQRPTTVHVILLTSLRSASGGANQTQVGQSVAQYTKGHFDNINSASRIASLLPEIGAEVAKSFGNQGGKFRITVERPADAKGDLGKVSMSTAGSVAATSISIDNSAPAK